MGKVGSDTPKPYRISNTTRVYAVRLANDVADIIDRRAAKRKLTPMEYLRKFLTTDTR